MVMTIMQTSATYEQVNVSVVMSIWRGDKSALLSLSLKSVRAQTRTPSEVVIVIDGPVEEGLIREVRSFSDVSGIRTVLKQLETNVGLWNARNIGLGLASYEIIALHDADDIMHPLRLELQVRQLVDDQVDVLCAAALEFSTKDFAIKGMRFIPMFDRRGQVKLRLINPINHSSVLFRKSVVLRVGGYRSLLGVEDLDLWRRLAWENTRFGSCHAILQALGSDAALLNRRRLTVSLVRSELRLMTQAICYQGKATVVTELGIFLFRLGYRALPRLLMNAVQTVVFRRRTHRIVKTLNDFLSGPPIEVASC